MSRSKAAGCFVSYLPVICRVFVLELLLVDVCRDEGVCDRAEEPSAVGLHPVGVGVAVGVADEVLAGLLAHVVGSDKDAVLRGRHVEVQHKVAESVAHGLEPRPHAGLELRGERFARQVAPASVGLRGLLLEGRVDAQRLLEQGGLRPDLLHVAGQAAHVAGRVLEPLL
eukprot:CAMPEP_0168398434 /NCGR_PEP_ID=MMETSP0228-20121227/21576_1 /TAXON_ID=133427 /ORGANISM="Protoceratium reticulatum, Strain CCCM 535 (=CCMP 1889)" /LENGTH=168 /DNA_ID=CAMNT_0008411935 /DNA_START=18 /DNA_END=521 /DNA_ORIENTATION=-